MAVSSSASDSTGALTARPLLPGGMCPGKVGSSSVVMVPVGSTMRRGAHQVGPFPHGLPPNRTGQFPGIRLSSDHYVSRAESRRR